LPRDEQAAAQLLQKLLSQFPPAAGTDFIKQVAGETHAEPSDTAPVQTTRAELAPIDVREWLIEPEAEELARISFWDSLISE